MRLAALMRLPVVYVWTHDSIGLGEDGETHQPVEQLASLRAMPGMTLLRPADASETVEAWRVAIRHTDGPVGLVLTRQGLPVLDRSALSPASGVARGGYVLCDPPKGKPRVVLIASGSEVALALAARDILAKKKIAARVVSMPSTQLFDRQSRAYRERVLPPDLAARVSIEAGSTFGWEKYIGPRGLALGIDRFGASAPAKVLFEKFGLTPTAVARAAEKLVRKK